MKKRPKFDAVLPVKEEDVWYDIEPEKDSDFDRSWAY